MNGHNFAGDLVDTAKFAVKMIRSSADFNIKRRKGAAISAYVFRSGHKSRKDFG
ncbi:MAG: hypothetical protein K2K57_09370 [Oscillospiraceae bacterium]|nr:hypothetical protein [Oscillospiraceae bacterium]